MVLDIEKAKKKTLNILKGKRKKDRPYFDKYDKVYIFTTENLEYLDKLKGKKVLTVTGSFDQTLNLVYEGSKEIDNYDVNILTAFYAGLKYASMCALEYEEYLNFFTGKESFKKETYKKIRPYLSKVHQEYYDFIYKIFKGEENKIVSSKLFYLETSKVQAINSNPYLKTKQAYDKTKQRLKDVKINFLEKNLLNLDEEKKYDLILTSNIEAYLVDDYESELTKEEYVEFIKNKLSKLLEPNGTIQVSYQYYYKERISNYGGILKNLIKKNFILQKSDYLGCFKKYIIDATELTTHSTGRDIKDCIYYYKKR